ncbi:MAG: S9 family peptidase [Bacillota bacterium]
MKRRFELRDYYALKFPSTPQVSPDGRWVAFSVQGSAKAANEHYHNLWLVKTDGSEPPHRLTRGRARDTGPAWSPDGRYLAFLSNRPPESELAEKDAGEDERERKAQVWVLDLERGGEPRQVTARDEGVEDFDWSPDSTQIAFSSRDPDEGQEKYLESIRGGEGGEDKGPLVIDRTQHKHDLVGYLDEVRVHLFTVEVRSREAVRLTSGPCDETCPRWSPDGRKILFLSNRTGDADNNSRVDLWTVSFDGGEAARLTFGDVGARQPRWSPDGQSAVFVSSLEPENAYALSHLMSVDVGQASPVDCLASCVGEGFASVGGVVPDQLRDPVEGARVYPEPERRTPVRLLTEGLDRPVVAPPVHCADGSILFLAGDRGQTRLGVIPPGGRPRLVHPRDRMMSLGRSFDARGGVCVYVLDGPREGADLYAMPDDLEGEFVRLTGVNRELLDDRRTAGQERITCSNPEGDPVEGLVVLPPDFDPAGERAPLIVSIHGGPMAYDSPGFRFDHQYWAGLGYLVLMVNYRGSISYGEQFCRVIRGDWGPREHDDLLSAVRELLDRGWADPERLYCTGFSYGGIMTNWAVGHTDIFRAAVSQHGLWDYISCFGMDDCHLWWQDDMGVPWHSEEQYRKSSPASGVTGIRTPVLITAGDRDWRCAPSQGEQMYLALKKRGVDTRLVIYQGERHAVSRPKQAVDRIRRICGWFARYGGIHLQDDSAAGYPSPDSE